MRLAHISISDADDFPIPPQPVTMERGKCNHTPCPEGYVSQAEWATKALRTHEQVPCPTCGLLKVWLPKLQARAINRRDLAESKRMAAMMDLSHANNMMRRAKKTLRKALTPKQAKTQEE